MVEFPLQVQQLGLGTDRVLVLGELAGSRAGDGWFTPASINHAFEAFRVPRPSNTNQSLEQLRRRQLVIRRASGGAWSLTPLGRERVIELMGSLNPDAEPATSHAGGAEFAHAVHTLIPPFFAPLKWAPGIKRFLENFTFDRNVFCMTRFPLAEHELDPLGDVIGVLREALQRHGFVLHLASDRKIDPDLWGNVAAHGWACRYGIALFENRVGRGLNHNLVAEVGAMLMTGRRCALLKDETQKDLPSDFAGQIYTEVDFGDLGMLRDVMEDWIQNDIEFG